MNIIHASFSVEHIESGYIVRDIDAKRAVHVTYEFLVARQIESFFRDRVLEALDAQAAFASPGAETDAEGVGYAMQNGVG